MNEETRLLIRALETLERELTTEGGTFSNRADVLCRIYHIAMCLRMNLIELHGQRITDKQRRAEK